MTSHLAQSTLFAIAAGLVTLSLRRHHARTRHWLWLAASVKFLVPFSLLVSFGSQVQRRAAPVAPPPQLSIVMEDPGMAPERIVETPAAAPVKGGFPILPAIWIAGTLAVLLRWWLRWHRAAERLREARAIGEVCGVPLLTSGAAMEPVVFGILRPRVLVPEGVAAQLSGAELEAVLAHELCHVRHRDNLAAALHMIVEALFWFHPLVWWIGARLLDERERACDEEVVLWGSDPEIYAASILAVCRLCVEPRVPCASGITGANLEKRIENILTPRALSRLGMRVKLLLAGLAALAVSVPVAVGIARAQQHDPAPLAFEVASVKALPEPKGWPWPPGFSTTPERSGGRIHWITSRTWLIFYAYHVQRWQAEIPESLPNGFFEIDAKSGEPATDAQIRLMLQTLLKDRFKFSAHRETKTTDGYELVVAKKGPKLREFKDTEEPPPQPEYLSSKPRNAWEHRVMITAEGKGISALTGRRVSMAQLAEGIEEELQTFVLDHTGMPGNYYFGTKFISMHRGAGLDVDGPSLFEALQEAMGLRLEKTKGPVDRLIVDHMEKAPSENQ